ncbi:MAG: ribosome maturation factor [Saprospiraceae bacterium]|nr:ribosome maturation factor [Saprospiraceae bacterium]
MIEQHVEEIVHQLFSTDDQFSDCFLLEVTWKKPKKIQVFFDADGGVDFVKCQKLSRKIEQVLDETGSAGEDYVLEVSSGGVDRPLQFPRQYPKHIGRTLSVETEADTWTGRLTGVEDEGIILEVKEKDPADPKKKKSIINQRTVPFASIRKAVVQIAFK